ncbi:MAG: class I SAM-dependent methyltransferase [Lachnospiraceae bacterium]|nr:class I SAM-dependent methyltransferase [Lachnospiraceae bacterium]
MKDIEQYTKNYMEHSFEEFQVAFRRKKVLEVIGAYKPKRILEIGCGMEPLFQYLDGDYESFCIVEPSKVFYENAVKLAEGNNVVCRNEFFKPAEELAEMKFDFIVCSGLLPDIERPEELFGGLAQISNPDTIIHVNTPNAKSLHRLIAKEMGLIASEFELSERNVLYQQQKIYDSAMLNELALNMGFEVVDSGSYFVKPFSHSQMYEMIQKDIISMQVLEGLYQLVEYMPEYGSEIYVNCRLRK